MTLSWREYAKMAQRISRKRDISLWEGCRVVEDIHGVSSYRIWEAIERGALED